MLSMWLTVHVVRFLSLLGFLSEASELSKYLES